MMKKLAYGMAIGLLSANAFAAELEDAQAFIGKAGVVILIAIVIVAAIYIYFAKMMDRRAAPVKRIYEPGEPIHSVTGDTLVIDCVAKMASKKIGALVVMDGDRLQGIFTERDALNRVLAARRDPGTTKVSEVMTKDPYCLFPETTVGAAMQVVTQRRFRHLPIVDDGKVLAVISSGDLTHWLVKDHVGEVRELVDLVARPK